VKKQTLVYSKQMAVKVLTVVLKHSTRQKSLSEGKADSSTLCGTAFHFEDLLALFFVKQAFIFIQQHFP